MLVQVHVIGVLESEIADLVRLACIAGGAHA